MSRRVKLILQDKIDQEGGERDTLKETDVVAYHSKSAVKVAVHVWTCCSCISHTLFHCQGALLLEALVAQESSAQLTHANLSLLNEAQALAAWLWWK